MATKVIMPKQGLQMTEGTITRWIIKEGEMVEAEQPLFEMETDKLNIEIVSPAAGTLLKIIKGEGEVVPITEIIAVIGENGEDISGLLAEAIPSFQVENQGSDAHIITSYNPGKIETGEIIKDRREQGERIFISPRAKALAHEKNLDISGIDGTGPEGLIIERDIINNKAVSQVVSKITPIANIIAVKNDIKPDEVIGTGARGKITKADIEAAITARTQNIQVEERKGKVIPFAGMRKVISDRMMQSLHNTAQANHRMKVDMTEIIRFREKIKAENIKVSFTDILVKVVSKALIDYPIINSSLTSEGVLVKDYVNMGLAVAVENGLIVPIIKDADLLTLEEISTVSSELIDRAKKGSLKSDEYTGGTFTITNLGMFDIDEFTAIINPPESAILAVGKIDRIPVAEGDSIVIKPVMMLSLTYDHRVIDGAPAAQFLQRVKQIMQNPYLLI